MNYSSSFFHCHLTGFLKDTSLHLCRSESSFLLPLIFSLHFRKNCASSVFFLKLESLQVLPWNLRQFISFFFALNIYSINLLKTSRTTFATGNAIYPLPRTIIQITNDSSIFRKEGIANNQSVVQKVMRVQRLSSH